MPTLRSMGFPMANAVIRRLQRGANPRQGSREARAAIDGHHAGPRYWRAFHCARALRVAVRGNRANHREHDRDHRGGEEVGMNDIRSWSLTLSTFGLATIIACDSPTSTPAPDPPPPVNVTDVSFTSNPLMVTAAVARVECSGPIAAVQVSYIGPGGSSSDYGSTPRLPVSACPSHVNVLGLLASTHYATWTTVWGEGGDVHTVVGPDLTTDALPPDLPQVTTQVFAGPPVGLTAFTVFSGSQTPPGYALIVDSIGRVRW